MKGIDARLIIGHKEVPVYLTTFCDGVYSLVLSATFFGLKISMDKKAAADLYEDLAKYLGKTA